MKWKITFLTLLCICAVIGARAQDSKAIEKLRSLYDEGKYLRVEFKCYSLSTDDQVRREPLLYLYWSMSSYEISQMDDQAEDYPNAYKDAIKHGVKFVKKDKDGAFTEVGAEHINKLKAEVLSRAEGFYAEENYKKARLEYKTLTKFDKQDYASWFMKSVCEVNLKLRSDARVSFETAMNAEGAKDGFASLGDEEQGLLKESFAAWFEANAEESPEGKSQP